MAERKRRCGHCREWERCDPIVLPASKHPVGGTNWKGWCPKHGVKHGNCKACAAWTAREEADRG